MFLATYRRCCRLVVPRPALVRTFAASLPYGEAEASDTKTEGESLDTLKAAFTAIPFLKSLDQKVMNKLAKKALVDVQRQKKREQEKLSTIKRSHKSSWERPSPSSLKNQSVTETAARRLFRQRFIDEERHRRGPNAELKHSKARWLKGFAEQTPLERHELFVDAGLTQIGLVHRNLWHPSRRIREKARKITPLEAYVREEQSLGGGLAGSYGIGAYKRNFEDMLEDDPPLLEQYEQEAKFLESLIPPLPPKSASTLYSELYSGTPDYVSFERRDKETQIRWRKVAVYEFSKHIDELVAWSARFEASDRANVPADEERRVLRVTAEHQRARHAYEKWKRPLWQPILREHRLAIPIDEGLEGEALRDAQIKIVDDAKVKLKQALWDDIKLEP